MATIAVTGGVHSQWFTEVYNIKGIATQPGEDGEQGMARQGKEPAWRKVFLKNLAETGNVSNSCYVAGISRPGAYQARKNDDAFAEAWDVAEEMQFKASNLKRGAGRLKGLKNRCFMQAWNAAA